VGFVLMKKYSDEILRAMNLLAKNPKCIFLGQSVEYPGNLIYKTVNHINIKKRLEVPVFEDVQMGMSIGLALGGFLPVSTYPRFDFLLLAFNQMINHLDKFPIITDKQFYPKVIIRVLVGAKKPLDAGEQHTQNYVNEVKKMVKTLNVFDLKDNNKVYESYKKALSSKYSSLMVEYSEKF
jgi:pyruvate/2-oxoglutarate/acetoin dehydrogenase E1 component